MRPRRLIPPCSGEITVSQMCVQYQVPVETGEATRPGSHGVWMLPSSSKTWETTPDGRMGWSEYQVRKNRPVYLADPSLSRCLPGFDGSIINAVKSGSVPPSHRLPIVLTASHQTACSVFRFGPTFNTPFPDGQFPIEAVDELYKQMIPDLNSTLPNPNPTWMPLTTAALAVKLHGAGADGALRNRGFFPEQAALIDPSGVKGIVSIEMPCPADDPRRRLRPALRRFQLW